MGDGIRHAPLVVIAGEANRSEGELAEAVARVSTATRPFFAKHRLSSPLAACGWVACRHIAQQRVGMFFHWKRLAPGAVAETSGMSGLPGVPAAPGPSPVLRFCHRPATNGLHGNVLDLRVNGLPEVEFHASSR